MTGLEKVCFWLMAALPWLQLTCILTDREQPTSKLICLSMICTAFAMVCWCVGY